MEGHRSPTTRTTTQLAAGRRRCCNSSRMRTASCSSKVHRHPGDRRRLGPRLDGRLQARPFTSHKVCVAISWIALAAPPPPLPTQGQGGPASVRSQSRGPGSGRAAATPQLQRFVAYSFASGSLLNSLLQKPKLHGQTVRRIFWSVT
jgi:hypothetical protein